MSESKELNAAENSLTRIQKFDAKSLVRKDELGAAFEFSRAVQPAKKLIALFQKLPKETLEFFPEAELKKIQQAADAVAQLFGQIEGFDPQEADASTRRDGLLANVESQYQQTFSVIFPFISFSIARTANFNDLADQGRATVQSIKDEVTSLLEDLKEKDEQAGIVLEEVRKAAAERGVSQEAFHFSKESEEHEKLAHKWQNYTVNVSLGLGVYSVITIFLHRVPWLAPTNSIETAQFVVSKVLIFGVLAYMLNLCAKNFLSHKHNQIVNKHRQNALMTYKSLVNAGGTSEVRDVVLQHAAAAIYQLHDTGYVKSMDTIGRPSIVDVMPRTSMPVSVTGPGSS